MAEGGRLVPFDKKVAEPGQTVTEDRSRQEKPTILQNDRQYQAKEHASRSDKMPDTRRRFAVLGQIKGPKIVVGAEIHRISPQVKFAPPVTSIM
jgi:hypothetical protein